MLEEKPQRQVKHTEILSRLSILDSAVYELWALVYKINPGLASPKTEAEVATESKLSLSEFFAMLPERISASTGSIREATETLEKELY